MSTQSVVFPNLVRVRVGLCPRAQPFDAAIDSLNVAMQFAHQAGFHVSFEKVRGGSPGFETSGPVLTHFLESGDTHFFNAADDVIFPPDCIVRLVNADKDVVSGIYRKNDPKGINPANYFESSEIFSERFKAGGLYETPFASGHSMTIKRHVIEKMVADYPELSYRQGDATHHALFLPMIHENRALQDDWAFSLRARQSGFTLWDDFDCRLKHYCYDFLGFESFNP